MMREFITMLGVLIITWGLLILGGYSHEKDIVRNLTECYEGDREEYEGWTEDLGEICQLLKQK